MRQAALVLVAPELVVARCSRDDGPESIRALRESSDAAPSTAGR